MFKTRLFSKLIPFILIASFLTTSCDVPDISEFTKQSAEMTSGIRTGVKDTGDLLANAAGRKDLFSKDTLKKLKNYQEGYEKTLKPTLDTLEGIDDYLETLNAIAKANKESAENAKAVVGSVGSLVTSASSLVLFPAAGVELPGKAVKVATGLLAAFEQFRTARSFKKRVNMAAEIIEGRADKKCTVAEKEKIQRISQNLDAAIKQVDAKAIPAKEKEIFKKNAQAQADLESSYFGCGVIDLLKFTMTDLKRINTEMSNLMLTNFGENNRTIFAFYGDVKANELRIQREPASVEKSKDLIGRIRDEEDDPEDDDAPPATIKVEGPRLTRLKRGLKLYLDDISARNPETGKRIKNKIAECDDFSKGKIDCAGMMRFLTCVTCLSTDSLTRSMIEQIPNDKFRAGGFAIESVLDVRSTELFIEEKKYKDRKDLMENDHSALKKEFDDLKKSRDKLNKLLDTSVKALDTWTKTHAKMREAVNNDSTLSVAALIARVKEIQAIIEPAD